MPIDRDRERARRRYARRQVSQQARAQRQRRNQQVVGAVVAVLVVVGGVLALTRLVGDPPATRATSSTGPKQYPSAPPTTLAEGKRWTATVTTNRGVVTMELYGDEAPQTVSSFLFLARDGYYDKTPCHRLTLSAPLQVLQCGDPTGKGTGGPGYGYGIENAPADGKYPAGTLAMARGNDPNTNGSQFFVTWGDSTLPTDGGGYSIFGRVTKGLDVVQGVADKGTSDGQPDGSPKEAIDIESIAVKPA
ncbi:peptidylprolyl isomerase [Angustibacter aerolatus]